MCSVCSTVLRSLYVLSVSLSPFLSPSFSLVSPFFILYLVCSVSVFLFSFFVHLVAVDFVFIVCRQSAQDKNWYMTADRVCINGKH